MKNRMAMAKALRVLVVAAPILYLVFIIAIGIMTQVAYSKNGFYPDPDSLFDAIRGIDLETMRKVESGWETVGGGAFLYTAVGFFVYGYTMSCILNIIEGRGREKAKGILPLLAGFGEVGVMAYYIYASETHLTDSWSEMQENLLAGRNPIREALKAGRDIEKLLVQRGELSGSAKEIIQMARERHIIVQEVDKSRLDELSPHHQGMLAFASAYRYSTVEEMLDLAKDPHNLGAVIRTAECAGAHGVIIPERRSVGLTPAAVKASAGAVEHLKVAKVTNLTRTMDQLKKAGIWAYAVTMGGQDYRKVRFDGGVLLVIGSEGEGISRLVLEHCDQQVSLPMKGQLDSLNASVAAGIMMYQVMAGRQK